MDILILISIVAFFTAVLTFFSGFGLGTILSPVLAIFFPIEIAIALTGVVHFFNKIFQVFLIGRLADRKVLLRFGLPAIFSAFLGAWLLLTLSDLPALHQYSMWGREFFISPVKLVIAVILLSFSILELLPKNKQLKFWGNNLLLGGVLSGFFGGLAGVQGALRSAFLVRSGLSKEAYIATGVVIAGLVDFTRISVYVSRFTEVNLGDNLPLLISASVSAIAGAFLGKLLLKKVTLRSIQIMVAVMLIALSMALGMGLI
jgi:uncharacterized protein